MSGTDTQVEQAIAARTSELEGWIDTFLGQGIHLLALAHAAKVPAAGSAHWPDLPAPDRGRAIAWLHSGGNLGLNLGRSGLIGWDADNSAGAEALLAAGYQPVTVPANAQNPNHSKGRHGGRHFLWRVPEAWRISGDDLMCGRVKLGGGGVIDALAGRHYMVLPPSVIAEENFVGTYRDAGTWTHPIAELPQCFWPDEFRPADAPDCPPGLEALRGAVRRRTVSERVEQDARSDELSEAIDAVSWDEWLAHETRLSHDSPAACGCERRRWVNSSNDGSVTLHAGCWVAGGNAAHIFSETMAGDLGLGGPTHLTRLQLAALLRGVSEKAAAASVGITLGGCSGEELAPVRPEHFEAFADEVERTGWVEEPGPNGTAVRVQVDAPAKAARCREAAGEMRRTLKLVASDGEEVGEHSRIAGGVPVPPTRPGAAVDAQAVIDEAAQSAAAEALADKRDPYRHTPDPCDEELEERVFGTIPQVGAIRDVARAAGMSPWSTLGLSIGRGLLRVHPSVLIEPLVGGVPAPLNFQLGVVGASGRGKGAAHGLVWYTTTTADTIDGCNYDKKFQPPSGAALSGLFVALEKDEEGDIQLVPIRDAAWCDWSEVDTLTATAGRGGNDLGAQLRVAITGAELGTDPKREGKTPLKVEPLSYRILVSFSTQYGQPAASLMTERDGGTLQRTCWCSTTDPRSLAKRPRGVPRHVELDILRRLPPGRQFITVDEAIHDEVWEAQAEKIRFDRDINELGGHRNLTKLRVAAWVALIQQRTHIGTEEWSWAEAWMTHSDRVRDRVEASVKGIKKTAAVEAGELDFVRRNAAEAAAFLRREKLLGSLAAWGRDVREARNEQGKKYGPRFTVRDIKVSAKGGSERETHAEAWALELVERGLWARDGMTFWSVEPDPGSTAGANSATS